MKLIYHLIFEQKSTKYPSYIYRNFNIRLRLRMSIILIFYLKNQNYIKLLIPMLDINPTLNFKVY